MPVSKTVVNNELLFACAIVLMYFIDINNEATID